MFLWLLVKLNVFRTIWRVRERAQRAKVCLLCEPEGLSSIPGTHVRRRMQWLDAVARICNPSTPMVRWAVENGQKLT